MYLSIRNKLPWLVAASWLILSWQVWLGGPDLIDVPDRLRGMRVSGFDLLTWFAAMIALMLLVDRLWCEYARWRIGVDPMRVHWSRLRNRNGFLFCAACQSTSLLPPTDFSDTEMVHCADCGHAIAPYGEMKPLLKEQGRIGLARLARGLRH